MADIQSKNMYALLGNDPEEDSDREPEPPTKAKDKPVARVGKRDGPDTGPVKATGGESRGGRGGGRGRGRGGNEGAFADREAGAAANRRNQDYVNQTDRPYRGRGGDRGGRGRGGRGSASGRGREFRDQRDDRHSHGRPNEHEKQADQSWGAPTGDAEWNDEQAAETIAKEDAAEATEANATTGDEPVNADGEKLEDKKEEVQKTWEEHLVEQAEKKLALGGSLEARKANEGSKVDKKWADAKALNKEEEEEDYFKGGSGKATRQRERKEKQTVEIDHRFQEAPRGDRGGRGGRGRGEYRGSDRGDRGGGRGRGRGEHRGGRGGERGSSGRGGNVNTSDESAFPKLGA